VPSPGPGEVLVRVAYSSLNYKDALSAHGNKGVTWQFPHQPGIDAAGTVTASSSELFSEGDQVIVCGYDLGMNTAGGLAEYIRVPASWVVALPEGLSLRDSMILGTAGFTAALCVEKLLTMGATPDDGEVVVTGATGGVGSMALMLLQRLGFQAVAVTGKPDCEDKLLALGAARVIARDAVSEAVKKPMLKPEWAHGIDTAGGDILVNVLKSLAYGGSVACCGLVQSPALNTTVLPFILRGINLLGVDCVELPLTQKAAMWQRLGGEWQLGNLDQVAQTVSLEQVPEHLERIYCGDNVGRILVDLTTEAP